MRGTSWLSLGAAVFGLGAVLACSSSTAGPPYPTVQSFCAALAQAECQVSAPCGIASNTCETAEAANCELGAAAASTSGRAYNTSNAKACIDLATKTYGATIGANPNPLVTASALTLLNSTCEDVFAGSVADNLACTSDYDCVNSTSVCTRGFCGPKTSVAKGGDCNNPGDECTDSYCGPTSAAQGAPYQCLPLLADGQACQSNDQCIDRCVGGLCAPLAGPGQSCTTDTDCNPASSSGFCDPYEGYVCDEGETFGPTATALCGNFGFGAQVSAPTVTPDAGSGGTVADANAD